MKKYVYAIMLFAMCLSCKDGSDLLDPAVGGITEEDVFTDAQNSMLFLNDIYGDLVPVIPQTGNKGMRWPGNDVMLDVTTDNGSSNLGTSSAFYEFNVGSWTPLSGESFFWVKEWKDNWASIRSCNLFLSHVDEIPLSDEYQFTEKVRAIRKGECVFLKAFFYAELLKQFGGLPIADKVYSLDDEMNNPRNTFDETVNYITDLCDKAAALLPENHPDVDYGRATKGAALALKARVLLYSASPLWNNPSKPEDSPFRGKFDETKWKKAAQAAADVINLNQYELHSNISDLFLTRVNREFIFVHMNQPCSWMTSISIPKNLCPTGRNDKSGCNQVTYNLIKEYEILKDGKAYSIDDVASGYDDQNPYINRDPRFYRDCLFNGSIYQGKVAQLGEAEGGAPNPPHNPVEISGFNTHVHSVKFADWDLVLNFDARDPGKGMSTNQNFPYIRYAEVLLNYAEAMNEAFGPEVDGLGNGKTALWAVNQVRIRSKYPEDSARKEYLGQKGGMPPISVGLGKDEMREKIRHERRIELSFEEHRFWDVRRWMIEPETMTTIQAQVPIWNEEGKVRYEIRTIQKRTFERKMYRMPIPEQQIYNNPNLIQNPGWTLSPEEAD